MEQRKFSTIIGHKLYIFTGEGATNWNNDEGVFVVTSENSRKVFETLTGAYLHYIAIGGCAELWDQSSKEMVLVEGRKVLQFEFGDLVDIEISELEKIISTLDNS